MDSGLSAVVALSLISRTVDFVNGMAADGSVFLIQTVNRRRDGQAAATH